MEYLNLNTGAQIPMVGFGVFRVPDLQECENAVYEAIRIGYRLVDTATAYKNEEAVGAAVRRAIADGICTREELFVTSKLWVTDMSDEETAARAIDASRAYEAGKLRAIGVSNFYPNILTNFCEVVDVVPAVNQVELHPYYTQEGALETMAHYGVVPEAWAPLGGGRYNPFEDEGFRAIAEVHGKTVGQVLLRWNVQRGVVVIPKSTHVERIAENFDIWDFELTDAEMAAISSHNMGYTGTRAKHFEPDFVRMCLGK